MITGREDLLNSMIEAFIMEKGTAVFYDMAVGKAESPEARETFRILSRSEKEHMRYIEYLYNSIEDNRDLLAFEDFRQKAVPSDVEGGIPVKEVEARLDEIPSGDDLAVVCEAEAVEEGAYALYKRLSESAEDANVRVFTKDLMGWELKHLERLRELKGRLQKKS
jgi:rubrerythrin